MRLTALCIIQILSVLCISVFMVSTNFDKLLVSWTIKFQCCGSTQNTPLFCTRKNLLVYRKMLKTFHRLYSHVKIVFSRGKVRSAGKYILLFSCNICDPAYSYKRIKKLLIQNFNYKNVIQRKPPPYHMTDFICISSQCFPQ